MRLLCLALVLAAPLAAQPEARRASSDGFVESGGRLVYYEVVRDSVVVFGQGAEGRPTVTVPYAAFVDALERSARAGALDVSTLPRASSAPFALDVDDRAVVRLATAVPVGTLALGLLAVGLIALVGGAVVWERRARKARRTRAEFRRRLAAAREAERAHVARELHDGPVQDLCAVQVALGGSGSEAAREAVTAVVGELRALCDELRPSALDAFGVTAALAALADRAGWGEDGRLDVRFRVSADARAAADGPALSDEKRLALYRIAQEALNNAVQHADGTRIDLALDADDGALVLTVDDDGVGPPSDDGLAYAARGHYGLLGIQERADLLRATLTIGPSPLGGTRVALSIPVRALADLPAAPPALAHA
ncbi:sensor histidine kinase [Rubrivirga sp.]|uniref:sensor histidine kinase n=1 Tax=Rubrivirga sp. TaxID=1885344 RepID=UPI003B5199E9